MTNDASRPHIAAQSMELTARYADLQRRHDIRPGMLVREKRGLGTSRTDIPIALIVLRLLRFDDPFDRLLIKAWVENNDISFTGLGCDCLVGMLTNDALGVAKLIVSTDVLEPVPSQESAWGIGAETETRLAAFVEAHVDAT